MSTKTTFKRVALVAVAALGFGMLSVVPSNAAAGTATAIAVANSTLDDGVALAVSKYTSNPVRDALQISAFSVVAGSSVALHITAVGGTFTTDDKINVAMRGYGFVVSSTAAAVTISGAEHQLAAFVAPTVPGTYTLDVTLAKNGTYASSTDLTTSVAMTVTAAAGLGTNYSTAYIAQGAALGTMVTNALGATLSKVTNVQAANITVTLKDALGGNLSGQGLCAAVSGPGTLGITSADATYNTASTGRSVCLTTVDAAANNELSNISVWSDGTAGTSSIVITSGTATIATKSVVFYGTVAKLVPLQNLSVARASTAGAELGCDDVNCAWATTATTPAVYIQAVDADGNVVPGLTIVGVSSNPAVITSASIAEDDATAGDGPGYYNASVTSSPVGSSGATATVTFSTQLSTGAYVSTNALAFTLGGSIATMTLTLDKATYAPGEAMVVTRTAKDSAGNPVYDGVASPAVIFTKAVGGTLPAAGAFTSGKSATSTSRPSVFAPSQDGTFEARATYTVAATGASVQITATAAVTENAATAAANAAADAAAEATDAANAATDAANAAAEAADAATAAAQDASDAVAALAAQVAVLIAGLKAQLTALTNLIIKIQKKLKA